MRSIRSRLTVWILGGLALLLIASGAGVYLSIRNSLLKSIDAELAVDARVVRFVGRGDDESEPPIPRSGAARRLQDQIPEYNDPAGSEFFQRWDTDGNSLEKSASLGEISFEFPGKDISTVPVFANVVLEEGREIRTMQFRAVASGKGKGKGSKGGRGMGGTVTVLGKELTVVNESLASVFAGLILIGVLATSAAILIIHLAINRGLYPVDQLAEQTAQIDANSLDARFDDSDAPLELQPIYHHLNDLIQRLEISFERERRFSSDLAHELRTPIAELKLVSEVALKWPDQAGVESHAETLEISNQLERIVETMLSLARWESKELPLKLETTELGEFVRKMWQPYSDSAKAKDLRVEFELEECPIKTDRGMLEHIVTNLFSNAVEYTNEGGLIKISVSKTGVKILNSAPDFREEDIEKIFERCWRADSSRSDSSHSGLGLALAKTCADGLGAKLKACLEGEILVLELRF